MSAEEERPLNKKEILTQENVADSEAARSFGGITAKHPQDLNPGVVAGIVASPGTGKTTLAGTVVDSELTSPAVLVDSAANAHVIQATDKLFIVKSREGFATAQAIVGNLKAGRDEDIRSVIFDHITNMYNQQVSTYNTGDSRNNYQKAMGDLLQLTRDCVDLAEGPRRINFFFMFQEAQEARIIFEDGVPKEIKRQEILLSDKLQLSWPNLVPLLAGLRIGMYVDPYPRVLDFTPSANTMTKWQVKADARLARLPINVWNPSLGKIVDVMTGGADVPEEWLNRPKAQLKKEG